MGQEKATAPLLTTTAGPDGGARAGPVSWRSRLGLHPGWCLCAAAAVTAALWFSHMPSLLLRAQFYADDGGWYQAAYTRGPLLTLVQPAAGYLVSLQRLAAALSLLLPTLAAPTFFNLVALGVEVAAIGYLLSARMSSAIPSVEVRIALALLVIVLPNAYDTSGNLTNAQWHLALIAFLVVFAAPSRRVGGAIWDGAVLVLSGLSGPYCILLEPIIGWRWLRSRAEPRLRWVLVANSVCVLVQVAVILATAATERTSGSLGAGLVPLVTMLGRQVTLGLMVGAHGLSALVGTPLGTNPVVLGALAVIPVAACTWAAWHGPAILRAFCIYALLELGLALVAPSIAPPRWPNLGRPADIVNFHPGGIRYFLFPLLAFAISLGWLAVRGLRLVRERRTRGFTAHPLRVGTARVAGVAATLLLVLGATNGVPRDWLYPPYLDEHWGAEVQRLDTATPGTKVVIPINPQGWTVTLVAR